MEDWKTTVEIPPMTDPDNDGHVVSEPLLVYVACKGVIAFGECRMYLSGPRFRASGFMGDFNITHWMPLPKAPNVPLSGATKGASASSGEL